MSEWISVKDRLPKNGKWVIVFMNYGDMEFSRFEHGEWKYCQGIPTHWIPLPEPPEEKTNE